MGESLSELVTSETYLNFKFQVTLVTNDAGTIADLSQ